MNSPAVGIGPFAAAFRDGSDDPVRAITRALAGFPPILHPAARVLAARKVDSPFGPRWHA